MARGDRVLAMLERRLAVFEVEAPAVGMVLVAYNRSNAETAVALAELWAQRYPGPVHACLVSNDDLEVPLPPGRWQAVRGSNEAHEFSGYDEGMSALAAEAAPEVWLLLNDRLADYGTDQLDLMVPSVLRAVVHHDLLVGHLDELDRTLVESGALLPAYIRTNLFALSAASARAVGRLTTFSRADAESLLPPGWPLTRAQDHCGSVLDVAYLERLAEWLTGTGTQLRTHWYRATTESGSLTALREKAVAVVNEHMLAMRLAESGTVAVDVRLLHRQVGLLRDASPPDRTALHWTGRFISLDSRRERAQTVVRSALTAARRHRR